MARPSCPHATSLATCKNVGSKRQWASFPSFSSVGLPSLRPLTGKFPSQPFVTRPTTHYYYFFFILVECSQLDSSSLLSRDESWQLTSLLSIICQLSLKIWDFPVLGRDYSVFKFKFISLHFKHNFWILNNKYSSWKNCAAHNYIKLNKNEFLNSHLSSCVHFIALQFRLKG